MTSSSISTGRTADLASAFAPSSMLAVPASNARLMESARRRPAAALMLDLEDGVADDAKQAARDAVVDAITSEQPPDGPAMYIRINDPEQPWGRADLVALAAALNVANQAGGSPGVAAIIVPKATPTAVAVVAGALDVPLVGLIETAEGAEHAARVAASHSVIGLMFGSVDYATNIASRGGWHLQDLTWVKSRVVNAAAAGQAWALAGPCTELQDQDVLRREATQDARLGFAGKLCVHPAQLDTVNQAFAPTRDQVDWAAKVITAAQGSGADDAGEGAPASDRGALRVDGQMIDRPLVALARLIAAAEAGR